MVWIPFWSSKSNAEDKTDSRPSGDSAAKCPVDHSKFVKKQSTSDSEPAVCPVDHESLKLDPRTNMPVNLSAVNRIPGQRIPLPTERTVSSIPRGESEKEGLWEYPSPQQMLNAMFRKGHKDTKEEEVPAMVDVHNFLNEGAWSEILKWEEKYAKQSKQEPRLLKFTGRPDQLSPRAQLLQFLGKVYPSKYATEPPFDRHDWTVLRYDSDGNKKEVRYVIDYYSGPADPNGYPSFFLDVRPALDSVESARDRFSLWSSDIVSKTLGEGGRKE
ncbi:cytochrome c/c1 heme-lyase [Lipomyces japonicus]|uniref:cytochrome c/c1 heme-lyase n=1 Tax=Lipomyces japonicus TaxID=56871 RepID=UPI0034CF6F3B